jgi:hypothetical protein
VRAGRLREIFSRSSRKDLEKLAKKEPEDFWTQGTEKNKSLPEFLRQ